MQALKEILRKEVPFHLEELKLIDLKLQNPQVMPSLLEWMQRKSYLQSLSLVNVKLSIGFDLLLDYIKSSKTLINLDLSWL